MATFPSVWRNMAALVEAGRLLAPHAVLEEIRRGDDELVEWADSHRHMFRATDQTLLDKVKEVLRQFPDLVDPLKEEEDADPYVVAQAILEVEGQTDLLKEPTMCGVVTQEHRRLGRTRIPHACSHYAIECFDFRELFKRENWQF
jgi:Domain of unknown function (DUF4411)